MIEFSILKNPNRKHQKADSDSHNKVFPAPDLKKLGYEYKDQQKKLLFNICRRISKGK